MLRGSFREAEKSFDYSPFGKRPWLVTNFSPLAPFTDNFSVFIPHGTAMPQQSETDFFLTSLSYMGPKILNLFKDTMFKLDL